ncbi:hypothetical protein PAHAL_2G245200 [Panicum hallii]|jgi:hypothetical protein|uniref:Bifunctional inhibitor/plant lipid transfer protein/seed storage helical domain-containing protein n=1 Tax=Panicum hallii TaxID=206008 RepID=A0A2T8KQ75_9POAL|nr:hypothetical protein PAHAL_2G245200 [Panicum hallii]
MAAKTIVLFALLALSVSTTTAVVFPPYYSPLSAIAAINTPLYFPHPFAVGSANPWARYYAQQEALTASIAASSVGIVQQPWATSHQHYQAHQAVQSIIALQQQQQLLRYVASPATYLQQQFLPFELNQLAVANPATYWQQQQVLRNVFNQFAVANPAAAYAQTQQLLPNVFHQFATVNPVAYLQLQQVVTDVFSQVALANPAAYWQQPFIGGGIY